MSIPIKDGVGSTKQMDSVLNENSIHNFININKDFYLAISMGLVPGHKIIRKFGENPDISTGSSPEDIWEFGGLYPFSADGVADIISLSSSDNSDTEEITVDGLDETGAEVIQNITLTGQTRVALTTPLWRVNRIYNNGSVDIVGTVYCYSDTANTAGVPSGSSVVKSSISNGQNQSLQAVYTTPKGYVAFLLKSTSSISRSGTTGLAQLTFDVRRFGKVFRVGNRLTVSASGTGIFIDERSVPDVGPALTDVKIKVESVSANNTGVAGTFDILLIDETQFPDSFLAAIKQPGY